MSTNLPISGLNEQKFDINQIKANYDNVDEAFDVDERLMYFAVAFLNGSNYVSRKIGWLNLMQSYMFSQQFAVDIAEIIHMNGIVEQYEFFYDNVQLLPDQNNRITIPKPDLSNYYTKLEIESLLDTKITEVNNRLDTILNYRYSYDILLTPDPTQDSKFRVFEQTVPIIDGVLGENVRNIKLYEKINENQDSTSNSSNYNIESYAEVLINKEIIIGENTLKIKLFFENTDAFEGKLIIN